MSLFLPIFWGLRRNEYDFCSSGFHVLDDVADCFPQVLVVLHVPLHGLDLIQRAIAKLVEVKTVIMIAHRLRTVVDADQILVLDNGRLVEHGTHDELMKKNGLYHKLFHIQQESLGWAV